MKIITYWQSLNLSVVCPAAQGTGWWYLDEPDAGWWDVYLRARRN